MGLTLPGLLGRVFQNATDKFISAMFSGDTYPDVVFLGDGATRFGDGTQDLAGTLAYLEPHVYIRGRGNRIALYLEDGTYNAIRSIFEIADGFGAPIFAVKNAGGIYLNDNIQQAYSTTGPTNFFTDVYGHLQLDNSSVIRITPGVPGNNLTTVDATGEVFQRGRTGNQGSWTATNATYSAHAQPVQGSSPANLTNVRAWTSVASGNIVATTAASITGPFKAYPCPANAFCAGIIYVQAATTGRSKTLGFLFYNAAGSQIGSAAVGSAVTDNIFSWTRLDVQAVSPAATAYCALQLTITATGAGGEVHYDTAAGWWDGVTSSQVTAWGPPYTFRQDAYMPAATPVTGCTGNGVSPIVISVAAGHPYLVGDTVTTTSIGGNAAANQSLVPITATTSTSITIAGTGTGNYTSGGSVQMTNSALGLYDGAFVGDVWIRSDGPANVVQRFATNAAAGVPSSQNWVNDPRITSQPARLNWYGGDYLQQTGSTDLDYTLPNVSLGMLHNDPPDSVNRGVIATVGQWNLLNDASNAQAFGGLANFCQAVRKKSTGAPYVSKDGMFTFLYGLWDLAMVTSGGGSSEMALLNATSTGGIVQVMREMICHARASSILPYNDSHFVLTGQSIAGTVQYAWSNGGPGVGGNFAYWLATTGTWTFTIPADFTGGSITITGIGAAGANGGTWTFTGTIFSTYGYTNPGPNYVSSTVPIGARARVVLIRLKNLTAAAAGLTVIGTVTQVDAGSGPSLDCAYIEGQYPNVTAVCGVPRLPAGAGYAALAGAGSYWNGNSGSTGDGDVQQMNTALQALVAEFDSNCFYVDLDSALQKYAPYFASDGFSMGALGVHAMASQFVAALQAQLPLVNFRNINHDYHDTTVTPVGGPFYKQGPLGVSTGVSRFYCDDYYYLSSVRASVNTAPQGASIIVDVLKNGSTIFTTTGNRPTITAGTNSAVSAAPDLLFCVPGDYLTINVAQTGTTVSPGADLTVNVLGRRIPIP